MADEADRADADIEMVIAEGIRRARAGRYARLTGLCLNCDADLSEHPKRQFCDGDCRSDFEHRERAMRRAGVN